MRLTLDARLMSPANTRGIGRYIEELIQALVHQAPEHKYTLLVKSADASPFVGHPAIEHVIADVPWYGAAEQIRLPGLIASTRPDLLHVPHWNVSLLSRVPRVVTIHDVILMDEPLSANVSTRGPIVRAVKRAGYRMCLRDALYGSRRVLAPTASVEASIRRHFSDLQTPIDVTGEGMPQPDASLWSEPDMSQPYLLYVGSAYPHKNLDLLLRAWERLSAAHPSLTLVFAGDLDAFMRRLQERVQTSHLPNVRFLGRVTDEELSRLYSKALAFVFPSRLEGFGLPPLEALAHGCPVLSSTTESLAETLGPDGAIFFQPSDQDGIVRAVEMVLRDPVGVRAQARLAAQSLRRRHDWKHTAERTLVAYEKAVHTTRASGQGTSD